MKLKYSLSARGILPRIQVALDWSILAIDVALARMAAY